MLQKINQQLDELLQLVPFAKQINSKVSDASLGWHLAHILITVQRISGALKQSDPANYKSTYNFRKQIVLGFNYIPRGKVKAPKAVIPQHDYNSEELMQNLEQSRAVLQEWNSLGEQQHFLHPVFGCLNKKETLRFLYVHTSHHLKIIRDISKA